MYLPGDAAAMHFSARSVVQVIWSRAILRPVTPRRFWFWESCLSFGSATIPEMQQCPRSEGTVPHTRTPPSVLVSEGRCMPDFSNCRCAARTCRIYYKPDSKGCSIFLGILNYIIQIMRKGGSKCS